MIDTVIKETNEFRLRVKKNACLKPEGLNNIEFIQEQLKDGEVKTDSTYQFFMTDNEIAELCQGLQK